MNNPCLFCFLASLENLWFSFTEHFWQLIERIAEGIYNWYELGGLYRIVVFIVMCLCLLGIKLVWERISRIK